MLTTPAQRRSLSYDQLRRLDDALSDLLVQDLPWDEWIRALAEYATFIPAGSLPEPPGPQQEP